MTDTDELIDFSILPASRVQNYEQKIEEQYSKIENLNKKVTDLESILEKSKTDAESKSELENLSNAEESISSEPSVKEVSGSIEKTEADKVSPPSVVKETVEPSNCKIIKGKNLNKECRTCQLREKLNDSDFPMPENIDEILAAALGSSKKVLPNEEMFYKAIMSNNLVDLIKNSHKFEKYIKPSFYKI